jgi:phosphate:Na+ symporter
MIGQIVFICFKLLGALCLFMYGMQLSSDGIQSAAGRRLQRTVNFMTGNRIAAVLTGMLVTVLIQSSSATSVMVVSFVNAGLLSLVQAIGVLMGAHVGTTLTGWIIAAVGIGKFSISVLAVPLFGLGYVLTLTKKWGDAPRYYGSAVMGFAMIFLGLEFLASAIPDPSGDALLFLAKFSSGGPGATAVCLVVGLVFTMAINASSATLAITIGLAAKGIISFPMAAAIVLGANIGTTFDGLLACIGTSRNSQRAAFAHSLLSIVGVAWVLAVFRPFLAFVDWATPGALNPASAGAHIAMLHTLFNTANTIVFLPFIRPFADLLVRVYPDKPAPAGAAGAQAYVPAEPLPIAELNLVQARADIIKMSALAESMYGRFVADLFSPPEDMARAVEAYKADGVRSGAMRQGISRFLLTVAERDLNELTRENIGALLRVVADLENVADSCLSLGRVLESSCAKKACFEKEELRKLRPYADLVRDFLAFVRANIDKSLSDDQLGQALRFEKDIDDSRAALKRLARKRLKAGADVKTEFLFIDLVRHMEKVGDFAYSIAESLRELK